MSAAGGKPLACSQDLKASADRLPAQAMDVPPDDEHCPGAVMGEVLIMPPAGAVMGEVLIMPPAGTVMGEMLTMLPAGAVTDEVLTMPPAGLNHAWQGGMRSTAQDPLGAKFVGAATWIKLGACCGDRGSSGIGQAAPLGKQALPGCTEDSLIIDATTAHGRAPAFGWGLAGVVEH
mmetsp:Transcript_30361/g.49488  ORF Transcript_30361/g.49488 Transcript_30361/m.49488 type:complete len:176 (+) Transcript_30361:110-637(+)